MPKKKAIISQPTHYHTLLSDVSALLEQARRASSRAVNAIMTATYLEVGRRIVQGEQAGQARAAYGENVISRLSEDLTPKFGRGFSERNLEQMRLFYLKWQIPQTPSAKSLKTVTERFPLSWSHYIRLLSVTNDNARNFYETEALRGGWSVRQLDRQISSQFFERTALSRNKTVMLFKGSKSKKSDITTLEQEIKDPYVLEFLDLKDEYSENDLEEALIKHLEIFLLELGGDFTFVARQKRLRVGNEWFRVDLVFYHRGLRCLILIDLKLKKFTHADAGQMHMYLNYAKANWTRVDENPPVGLILCAEKDASVAKYSLEGLPNKILATEYKTKLPNEKVLVKEIEYTRKMIEGRTKIHNKNSLTKTK